MDMGRKIYVLNQITRMKHCFEIQTAVVISIQVDIKVTTDYCRRCQRRNEPRIEKDMKSSKNVDMPEPGGLRLTRNLRHDYTSVRRQQHFQKN